MGSSFRDRLLETMKIRNIKAAELAVKSGLSKQQISQYTNGRYVAKHTALYKLAGALNVSEAWLMGYDVPMERGAADAAKEEPEENAVFLDRKKVRMIPVYESVSAGHGALASDYIAEYIPAYIESDAEARECIGIRVKGDSMSPKIEDGDIILVRRQDSVDSGQVAVVLLDNEEGLVKKVVCGLDWIELHSFNPMYKTMRFEGKDTLRVTVFGLVKKVIKNI